jgi:glycosyltransferase involved in cell wall biosynthesis
MNLATLRRDAPLLQFAGEGPLSAVCFIPQGGDAGLVTSIPGCAHCYDASTEDARWEDPGFWNGAPLTARPQGRSVAIFVCDLTKIPLQAFNALRSAGISEILFLTSGSWHHLDISTLRGRIGLSLMQGTLLIRRAQHRAMSILKRAVLKRYAVDLRAAGASEFCPESGKAFTSLVPFLAEHADGPGVERSSLLLFEESTLLSPHHSHDAIRTAGGGRYSLWGTNLYLSSTDGSDPRFNGRRYRYMVLDSTTRKFAKLCSSSANHAPGQTASSPSRLGSSPLVQRAKESVEDQFARLMQSSEARGYPGNVSPSTEVDIFITNLGPGGAERQMTYLAQGLTGRDVPVRVLTYFQSAAETLHYKPVLENSGVPVDFMTTPHEGFNPSHFASERGAADARLIASLPDEWASEVLSLYSHLVVHRPAVLHCWLDQSNIIGAVAGWLAGVPRIVLSSRSVNPTHFPHIIKDWYQTWYKIVSRCPRVHWVANSEAGATSYGEWMDYPVNKIRVVRNGLDLGAIATPSSQECLAFRNKLGIPSEAPVITAVFRLSHEKRPLRFIRLVWELRKQFPQLHALIAGIGPMEDMVKRELDNLKLHGHLHLLGKRSDVPLIMRASDVVVLCSSIEGSPNVLIEAGWLGRPVVTTAVGDVTAIVQDGTTGFICDRDNFKPLLESVRELAANPLKRERFGTAARDHIGQHFSIERMVDGMAEVLGISTPPLKDQLCA